MVYFIETPIENLITIKKIIYFSENNYMDTLNDRGETHDFWEMVYVTDGQLIEVTTDTEQLLNAGEILFHHPNRFHKTKVPKGANATAYHISFISSSKAMDFFRNYHDTLSDTSKQIITTLIEEGKNTYMPYMIKGKHTLLPSPHMQIGGPQIYRNYMEVLLINILREQCRANSDILFTSKDEYYTEICKNVCEYLAENIYSDLTLDDITQKFNFSRTVLCSKFKEYKGTAIMQYYTSLKIEEACKLIKAGTHSVSKIAELLNYSNQYCFSRTFKRIVGLSPLQYKSKYCQKSKNTN